MMRDADIEVAHGTTGSVRFTVECLILIDWLQLQSQEVIVKYPRGARIIL